MLLRMNLNKERPPGGRATARRLPAVAAVLACSGGALAQVQEERMKQLENQVQGLQQKLDAALGELGQHGQRADWTERLSLGGYGESKALFTQGSDADFIDHNRVVLYLGYRFADWIDFHSELEIEHSFVEDGNGEIAFEQLYTDLHLDESYNVRVGRYLVPVGITNLRHEPTTFYSVQRPSLDDVIIPTTWWQDGIGAYGRLSSAVDYQLYVGSGLDGSGFDAVEGIRGGRQEERPGINEPGVTGRIDWRPWADPQACDLRCGASTFLSGLDNANLGTSGAPGTLELYAVDAQLRSGDLEFAGVYVLERVRDASALNAAFPNNVAERMQGWYVEVAYHCMPSAWKTGKLDDGDIVVFARYEDFDTQDKMPPGLTADPAGARKEATTGLAFFLTSQFVAKADVRLRDGEADEWHLGIGWRF